MTRREYTVRDIHMALDGEMPAEERKAFEIWLAANPDMKALSARFAADAKRLRETFAGILNEPVPDRLTGQVTGGRPRSVSWLPSWRTAAAAVVIFAIGVAGGYFAATEGLLSRAQGENQLAENAIGAYVTYSADRAHAVEVGASDKSYLENWLSKRTGLKLVAPDLTAEGFELLGGRVLPAEQRPAALLVYKNQAGRQVSIYVTAEGEAKTKGTYTQAAGGPTAIYWLDKDYGCAIVSSLPEEQLSKVARSAWRQLVEGASS
jgi:anti-sigma factor RsiW